MPQDTLQNRITEAHYSNSDATLSEKEQGRLLELLTPRCHQRTREALAAKLASPLRTFPNWGAFAQIVFGEDGLTVQLVAGQDYPSSRNTVRKLIIAG